MTISFKSRYFFRALVIAAVFFGFYGEGVYASAPPKTKEEKGAAAKDGQGAGAEAVDVKKEYEVTDNYIHSWIKFPDAIATSIFGDQEIEIKPRVGYVTLVVFLASWCLPCQKIFPKVQLLQKKYEKLNSNFYFVFVNDTKEDALGFAQEYGITRSAVLANSKLKTAFHNPQLPALYMSDRRTWLLSRHIKLNEKDLAQVEKLVSLSTSY